MQSPLRRRLKSALFAGVALAGVGVGFLLMNVAAALAPTPELATADSERGTAARFVETVDQRGFLRGNLHAHSSWSDGDVAPDEVLRWYRRHDYQFAALTDHNSRVPPEILAHLERSDFVILPGEEVTMTVEGKPVHVNALCTRETIGEILANSKQEALQRAVDAVRSQGGVALINHPNFAWALGPEQLASVRGAHLIEIASGHPKVNWQGDDDHPSAEVLWSGLLDAGFDVSAVAVDDSHRFTSKTMRDPQARPGQAWVGLHGADIDRASICSALQRGDLFASTGPRIDGLRVSGDTMVLDVGHQDVMVSFLGDGGEVLSTAHPGTDGWVGYSLHGGESYVRARLRDRHGGLAFTRAFRAAR